MVWLTLFSPLILLFFFIFNFLSSFYIAHKLHLVYFYRECHHAFFIYFPVSVAFLIGEVYGRILRNHSFFSPFLWLAGGRILGICFFNGLLDTGIYYFLAFLLHLEFFLIFFLYCTRFVFGLFLRGVSTSIFHKIFLVQ